MLSVGISNRLRPRSTSSRPLSRISKRSNTLLARTTRDEPAAATVGEVPSESVKLEGASTDLGLIWSRIGKLVKPYWVENPEARSPQLALAGVVALSLLTTGVSVGFNFLGRDFFNALSAKDATGFYTQLTRYLGGFAVGIPVFVFRDYFTSLLSLRWREWMTQDMLEDYMGDQTYYNIHSNQIVDNPDQRLTADINNFTSTFLGLAFTFLTSIVDLVSFSGILYAIYPPLFIALLIYAIGGTAASFAIGKKLVGLNFKQEAREADLRYGLVRIRENAESIAFYEGSKSEVGMLRGRLGAVIGNSRDLLKASRNLDFFQSAYRYTIMLLPAAVVAPLYFKGEIEFGVVNQSQSAFSHILGDVSLVVYQFESLAGFSAVVDRLGEFQESIAAQGRFRSETSEVESVMDADAVVDVVDTAPDSQALLRVEGLTLCTPNLRTRLVKDLSLTLSPGERLLIMGNSGTGKTSILRALGGLWRSGMGTVTRPSPSLLLGSSTPQGMMIVPQKLYMVLGSLRQQLLYPAFSGAIIDEALVSYETPDSGPLSVMDGPLEGAAGFNGKNGAAAAAENGSTPAATAADGEPVPEAPDTPSDDVLRAVLSQVGLEGMLERCSEISGGAPLDLKADWSTMLSLGEQQRLSFARVLLANPAIALLDECTSALDLQNEERLYSLLQDRGIAYVSVGHRASLREYHDSVLQLEAGADGDGANWEIKPCAKTA